MLVFGACRHSFSLPHCLPPPSLPPCFYHFSYLVPSKSDHHLSLRLFCLSSVYPSLLLRQSKPAPLRFSVFSPIVIFVVNSPSSSLSSTQTAPLALFISLLQPHLSDSLPCLFSPSSTTAPSLMWSDGGHKWTQPKPGIMEKNPCLCMNDGNSSTPLPPIVSFLRIGKDLFLIVGNLGALGGRDGGLVGERDLLNVTTLIPPGAALPSLFRTYCVLPVGWVRLVYRQVFSSRLCLLAGCFSRKGGFLSFFKPKRKKK